MSVGPWTTRTLTRPILAATSGTLFWLCLLGVPTPAFAQEQDENQEHGEDQEHGEGSRNTDEYIPLQLEGFPNRPKPLLELGQRPPPGAGSPSTTGISGYAVETLTRRGP